MAYEKQEFIVYSTTKSSFQNLVNSGGITNSQIGIISETSEFWAKGQYYPLVNLGEYLKKDDAVDFAKDLQGKVETTEETFTFRASAGDKSIRDSSAVISKIKGSSIIWNQYVTNGDFSAGTTGWRGVNATISHSNNTLTITNSSSSGCGAQTSFSSVIQAGRKILVVIDYKKSISTSSQCRIELVPATGTGAQNTIATSATTSRRVDSAVITSTTTVTGLKVYPNYNGASGSMCTVFSVQAFDLTAMFGAGNEPTYSGFSKLYPEGYYDQALPRVVGMCANCIDTVGFNCFNKSDVYATYISSSTGTTVSSTVYSTSGYIKVLKGETYYLKDVRGGGSAYAYAIYDSSMRIISTGGFSNNGTNAASGSITIPNTAHYLRVVVHNSFLNTCCVNLQHSSVSNGLYEEYSYSSRSIPEIKSIFPNGMHRVGDVYDELTSECAIKRIGVRNYASGDTNSNSMLTDGRTRTIYVLSTPERINIETPIQLEYYVEDFGIEDVAFWDRSAPFCADIAYRFNAEGRIRDNSRNIERLEKKFDNITAGNTPYVFKSFTAMDFVECEGPSLQFDIDPNDLQGGEISRALESGRPVYIRAGNEEDWLRGITPMRWIYEEDLIYGSFTNPINSMEYNIEIGGEYVSFIKTHAIPAQPNWNDTNEDSVSYILNKPDTAIPIKRERVSNLDSVDELLPGYLYEQTSALATTTVHGLTDDYDGAANFWMIRIPMSRNGSVINFDDTILWADGAPTYSFSSSLGGYGVFEITLKRDLTGHVLGEWKFFK